MILKVSAWDIRSGNIVQEYDRHLNPINSITFIDDNKRFVTTSDDKSIRVWEWDIPVDFKYIADPGNAWIWNQEGNISIRNAFNARCREVPRSSLRLLPISRQHYSNI